MNKRIWVGLIFAFYAANLFAQHTNKIIGGFNVDKFPDISFLYHTNNPEKLNKSDFWYLKESGKENDFNVKRLPTPDDELPQTTLILWEDMAHNGVAQFNFTQEVLSSFFNFAKYDSSDKFAISAFNRRKNKSSALINLTEGFTSNRTELIDAIKNYKRSSERYQEFPNRSDMYTAIREGMELLSPIKGSKAIIVFTSGYSMKNSGSDSESQVLLKAQQLHIPVYIFQYFYRSGVAAGAEGFAKSTYGNFNSYKDVKTAKSALIELYPQISERYQGQTYKITFTTTAERGSEPRDIILSVGGLEVQEQLLPPPHSLGSWISENILLSITLAIVLIIVVVSLIIFIRKTTRNAKANRQELIEIENRRLEDQTRNERALREQEQKAAEEIQRIKAQELIKEQNQRLQSEYNRLSELMRTKNIYPRLKYSIDYNTYSYDISKPETSIGREQDNDLVLNNPKVSRHHAKIVFNGVSFEIIDNQSTNKVIVNGQFVERTTLKSGDLIGLGEVVMTILY